MSGRVLSPEHRAVLAGLAEDTGGFRVNKDAATRIAEACAAALALCDEPQGVTLRQTRGPDGQSVLVADRAPAGWEYAETGTEDRAPVDVLAVLDARINAAKLAAWNAETEPRAKRHEQDAAELTEARAAVAELVEAAKVTALALSAPGAPTRTEREEMIASLRAALARIGGAK